MEGVVIGGGANNNVASIGVTSARVNARALGSSTQRRRVQGPSLLGQVQDGTKEARGLLQKQKQAKKSESFATSQRRKLGATANPAPAAVVASEPAKPEEAQPLQATSLMKSASSPYKITPGLPSYNQAAEGGVRGYDAYGPRLDVYSASLQSRRD